MCIACRALRDGAITTYGSELAQMERTINQAFRIEPDAMQQFWDQQHRDLAMGEMLAHETLVTIISSPAVGCPSIKDIPATQAVTSDITPEWLAGVMGAFRSCHRQAMHHHQELLELARFEASTPLVAWDVARWHLGQKADNQQGMERALCRLVALYCSVKQLMFLLVRVNFS